MKLLKFTALLLCCACLLCACRTAMEETSVSGAPESGPESAVTGMQLLFSESDSFNPYTAKTKLNRELAQLLFDPLVRLNAAFEPQFCLAADAVTEGTTCTVTLRDALFSDGTAVTAQDVVYSVAQARTSATGYAAQFYEVRSVDASGGKTVVFTLSKQDPYFVRLLDFPIIKQDSAGRKNSDSVELPPIGCGRYVVNETGDQLLRNQAYYGAAGTVDAIRLIHSPDAESVSHHVEIGATDLYFADLAENSIVRMSGKKIDVNMNDLVFIGVNGGDPLLQQPNLRYAVSSGLDRAAIVKTAYYNNAQPATGFFHPAFADAAAVQNVKDTADPKIVVENLAKIGYNGKDAEGYFVNQSGYRLRLSLLVNAENASRKAAAERIKAQLAEVGIEIAVEAVPKDIYVVRLKSGGFQLYLGEVRLLNNMDMTPLVTPGGSAAYGVRPATETLPPKNEGEAPVLREVPTTVQTVLSSFYAGTCGVADVASTLLTELPVIPICFRNGLLFYDDTVISPLHAAVGDLFSSTATGYVPE